ncbi:MAG: pyridoxamine 5'-phosphate oxidase [Myxococcaceae bacterium]
MNRITGWSEPFDKFQEQFDQLSKLRAKDPNAMVLATADSKGRPSARVVLLKSFSPKGFVFFTNYTSRKGRELSRGPAALCFYWPELDRQVRVEGVVKKVSARESAEYFHSRARLSQVGAWASHQSQPLKSRDELEQRMAELEQKFAGGEVPRPKHWGGYLLQPSAIELWEARASRLHVRELYLKKGKRWQYQLLNP